MKKRSILVTSLLGLALVACTDDDLSNSVENATLDEGGAFVSLKLDVASPETKGSPNPSNPVAGSTEESTISNATIVIKYADGTTKVVKTGTSSGDATLDATEKTIEFKAPEGAATFYVYANLPSGETLSNDNWDTDLVSTATAGGFYTDNNFFMSNQNGEGVETTIEKDNDNNVAVSIERGAAKVSVESVAEPSGDDAVKGTLKSMSFGLGNMANKFYLLAQSTWADITGQSYPSTATGAWKEVTLGSSAYEDGELKEDLSAVPALYCLENIQSNYYTQNTTYIKFKTSFIPGQSLSITGSKENGYEVGKLTNVSADAAATFYVVRAGDADLLSNYIMATDIDGKDGLTIKQTVDTEDSENLYTVEGLEGITTVEKYTDGTCWFGPIWINDAEDETKSPIYRNDWYHLKVTSITLPGSSSEPDTDDDDPETPLVTDANITVTATVIPWEFEERDIELK